MNPQFDQAMFVQRQLRTAMRHTQINAQRTGALDRKIIRRNRRHSGIGNPLQKALVVRCR